MCTEHKIALETINEHLNKGDEFVYEELTQEIIKKNGILRVSVGVTIRMYLKELCQIGLLKYDYKNDSYKVESAVLSDYLSMA